MKSHFYSHLITVETILIRLNELDLTDKQKKNLTELIETNIHHTIMDMILSELSEDDKKVFLSHVIYNDHSRTWEHLYERVENIEEKITKAVDDLKKELHKDIDATKDEN